MNSHTSESDLQASNEAQVKLVTIYSKLGIHATSGIGQHLELSPDGQKWFKLFGAIVGGIVGYKVGQTFVVLRNQGINAKYGHLRILDK